MGIVFIRADGPFVARSLNLVWWRDLNESTNSSCEDTSDTKSTATDKFVLLV
jgi:hypothetical protein